MRLLIVGLLDGNISVAGKIAIDRGAKVAHLETIEQALVNLRSGKGADMVMVDVSLNIKKLIKSLEQERISIPVVACGIDADPKLPVEAIKAGAQEYVPLPPEPDLIAAVLEAVTKEDKSVIYRDPEMKKVFKLAEQIAPSEASVLITGESGTGKEVMATFIHSKSRRKEKAFITVNCAAIPENLLESELFGHEKGAFTGAIARRIGKFEEADGGTLLLDEISEMHPTLQAKLLRAIQEREIDRVGGRLPVKVNIRLLATSNRDLEEEVKKGNFREDLYFRLNVVSVNMPSLRDRPADIGVLSEHFAEKYADLNHLPKRKFSPEAITLLNSYHWPGNVRELENAVHRAVLLATENEIKPEAILLPEAGKSAIASKSDENSQLVGRTVSEVEQELILSTLNHCFGNRTHAANILGISIRTLRNKLKQYADEGVNIPVHQSSSASSAYRAYG